MLEHKINKLFGDDEPGGFGTGWWSGILSTFFGVLALGAVIFLHFPQVLTSPELRAYYPMPTMRLLIQAVIVAAIIFGVASAVLRRKKILGLTGMSLALLATSGDIFDAPDSWQMSVSSGSSADIRVRWPFGPQPIAVTMTQRGRSGHRPRASVATRVTPRRLTYVPPERRRWMLKVVGKRSLHHTTDTLSTTTSRMTLRHAVGSIRA